MWKKLPLPVLACLFSLVVCEIVLEFTKLAPEVATVAAGRFQMSTNRLRAAAELMRNPSHTGIERGPRVAEDFGEGLGWET